MDFSKKIEDSDITQWVEYYRPKKLEDILLPKGTLKFFKKVIETKNLPSIVLHSKTPGSGKTSLAKLICDAINYEYMYINASKNRGIDVLRDNITRYATSKSITGTMKCVILDEFDGASSDLQLALKSDMELFSNKCRFILITNEYDSIDEKLVSRCQEIDMNYSSEEDFEEMTGLLIDRVLGILKHRKVGYDEEAICDLIINSFPDIRKVINNCDEYYKKYGYINKNILKFNVLGSEFVDLLKTKKLLSVRKHLAKMNYNYLNIFSDIDRLVISKMNESVIGEAILVTCDYMKDANKSINKEIMCAGYLQEIMSLM